MLSSINIYIKTFHEALAKKMELFSSQAFLISPKSELKKEMYACLFFCVLTFRESEQWLTWIHSDKWKNATAAYEEKLVPSFRNSGKSG